MPKTIDPLCACGLAMIPLLLPSLNATGPKVRACVHCDTICRRPRPCPLCSRIRHPSNELDEEDRP